MEIKIKKGIILFAFASLFGYAGYKLIDSANKELKINDFNIELDYVEGKEYKEEYTDQGFTTYIDSKGHKEYEAKDGYILDKDENGNYYAKKIKTLGN